MQGSSSSLGTGHLPSHSASNSGSDSDFHDVDQLGESHDILEHEISSSSTTTATTPHMFISPSVKPVVKSISNPSLQQQNNNNNNSDTENRILLPIINNNSNMLLGEEGIKPRVSSSQFSIGTTLPPSSSTIGYIEPPGEIYRSTSDLGAVHPSMLACPPTETSNNQSDGLMVSTNNPDVIKRKRKMHIAELIVYVVQNQNQPVSSSPSTDAHDTKLLSSWPNLTQSHKKKSKEFSSSNNNDEEHKHSQDGDSSAIEQDEYDDEDDGNGDNAEENVAEVEEGDSSTDELVFESFFDLTRTRLMSIFEALDKLSTQFPKGIVQPQVLIEGLQSAGLVIEDKDHFKNVLSEVDLDLDQGMTFAQFEAVVQSIKMTYLFRSISFDDIVRELQSSIRVPRVYALRFSSARAESFVPTPETMKMFMYGARPEWATMNWVQVVAPAPLTMKALAVKYRLHPLALEDALHNQFSQRAKVDSYDNHVFVVFPAMQVKGSIRSGFRSRYKPSQDAQEHYDKSKSGATAMDNGGRRKRRLFTSRVDPAEKKLESLRQYGSFESSVSSSSDYQKDEFNEDEASSLLGSGRRSTKQQQQRRDYSSSLSSFSLRLGDKQAKDKRMRSELVHHYNVCFFMSKPNHDTLITLLDEDAQDPFGRVRRELMLSYSRLRTYDTMYLMYALIDAIVDQYPSVIEVLQNRLLDLRMRIRSRTDNDMIQFEGDQEFAERYHDLTRELMLIRRRMTPALRVLNHLIESGIVDSDCSVYLRDVQEHLDEVMESLNVMIEDCRDIRAEHEHSIDVKLNKTMSSLTIVATVFLPAQFLASVFGMNFVNMPELEWEWGYPMFWALCLISWVFLWSYFKLRGI